MEAGRLERARAYAKTHWRRLLGSAALIAVLFGNQGFRRLVGNWLELRRLNREIVQLQKQQADLTQRLQLLHSGNSSLERMARIQLDYIKKGEIEYRFPPPDPNGN